MFNLIYYLICHRLHFCNFVCIILTSLYIWLYLTSVFSSNFPFFFAFLVRGSRILCVFLWSVVTRLWAGRSAFPIQAGAKDFFLKCPYGLWGTPISQSKGNRGAPSLELKVTRCEVRHSPPVGVQIREECSFLPPSLHDLTAYTGITLRFSLTFFLSVYFKFLFLWFPFIYWFFPYFCFVLSLSFIFSILSTAHWVTGLPADWNSN